MKTRNIAITAAIAITIVFTWANWLRISKQKRSYLLHIELLHKLPEPAKTNSPIDYSLDCSMTKYAFELWEKGDDQWTFKCSAWVMNPKPYWIRGKYYIEFRNQNGSLLKFFELPVTFPTVTEPREARHMCVLPVYLAQQVDFDQSRISIRDPRKK